MIDIRRNEPGTVIHGTLRTEDLLEAFANELEHSVQRQAETWCSDEGRALRDDCVNLIWDAREVDPDSEEAYEILGRLRNALDEFAPPGHSFGPHPGDGADIGYWPIEEENDKPRPGEFWWAKIDDDIEPIQIDADGKHCWGIGADFEMEWAKMELIERIEPPKKRETTP